MGLSVGVRVVGTRDTADFWERVYSQTTMERVKTESNRHNVEKPRHFPW